MSTSRAELMYNEVVAEFENISTANGYRTDPKFKKIMRDWDKVMEFPELAIVMGMEDVEAIDDGETFDEWISIYVRGIVQADTDIDDDGTNLYAASEALVHDIRRIVGEIWLKYANQDTPDTALKWNVGTPGTRKTVPFYRILGLGENANKGIVGTQFTVHLRNLDKTFSA